jgi:hypothetical protein
VLDLDRVAPQIDAMARARADQAGGLEARLQAGLRQWRIAAAEPERFAHLPRERNEPRLALPTHEALDHTPAAPPPPERFAVLAVDGSQIEPDFHEVAPCYLINVGHALLRYGSGGEGTRLAADPSLFYPEQVTGDRRVPAERVMATVAVGARGQGEHSDAASSSALSPAAWELSPDDDDAVFGSWGDLDAQRMLAEAETLARLMTEQAPRDEPAIAFLDGPLIAWRLDWITPRSAKQVATRNFLCSFEAARNARIPLAGYISRTRSTDLLNMLKYSACETAVATGSFCAACAAGLRDLTPGPSPERRGGTGAGDRVPCYKAFEGLLDRQLLGRLMPVVGMRSPVFQSNSSVLSNLYGEHRRVGFFFLNAGGEIGRVELPDWVWEDPARLDQVHSLVADQVTLGRGYPIAISEAHEQAVVRVSERQLFFDLVRRAFGRHDVEAELSAKAMRKRGPIA